MQLEMSYPCLRIESSHWLIGSNWISIFGGAPNQISSSVSNHDVFVRAPLKTEKRTEGETLAVRERLRDGKQERVLHQVKILLAVQW